MEYPCSINALTTPLKTLFLFVFCLSTASLSAQISCVHGLNVSLDNNCQSGLLPADILSNGDPLAAYTLMLTTASGAVIPGNVLDISHLWTTVTAKVTNAIGSSCWSTIMVEDKSGPIISCADITINCNDMMTYQPTAEDACTTSSVSILSSATTNLPCNNDYLKEVVQSYLATDGYGNTSSCAQTITLNKFDNTAIVWPEDFEIINGTNLTCSAPVDAAGNPDVTGTGVPSYQGASIFPDGNIFCDISVDYTDIVVIDFGCAKKIMRTWYVYEYTCNNTVITNHVQALEISDTELPVITNCPLSLTYAADGSTGCDRSVELELPSVTDDCSGLLEIDVAYDGGFVNNATANPVVTLSGSSVVSYTVYDKCDNSASCQTVVTISDNLSPTAICDQNSVVSLRADGTGVAYVSTFDDGSFDDCELHKLVVKRVTNDCGCDRPRFSDMSYLGDYNGHYYYLSDGRTSATRADGLAVGLGGTLVAFNTVAESDWVVAAATAITDSVYIGLNSVGQPGSFTWSNQILTTFLNWAPGQINPDGTPAVAGDHVILNEDGQWEIVSGGDNFRYVLEISDPCGFSDRVDFCCTDVSAQQPLILRAIDVSGRINECVSNVTVQDKIAPVIVCPADVTVSCGTSFDPNDSNLYGTATATDQCTTTIGFTLVSDIDATCNVGSIRKIWTASDVNGSTDCTQTFNIVSVSGYDATAIVWPADYEVEGGCNGNEYLPQDLPLANGYPVYTVGACDNITRSYSDDVYSFAGPASDACSKIVRTWSILDECMPIVTGQNPSVYQQAIKVNNSVKPTITDCTMLDVNSIDCNDARTIFSVVAVDDCVPFSQVTGSLSLDIFSDGNVESTINSVGNVISFDQMLPVGTHSAILSYSDRCGNVESCTKRIQVTNVTNPTAVCKNSVSVNIQAMDLDSDASTPDVLMAMVNPSIMIESTSNPCGYTLTSSFSPTDPNDQEQIFDCDDLGATAAVSVFVVDALGFVGSCTGSVVIQDNNNLCGTMLPTNEVILSGCLDASFSVNVCPVDGPVIPFSIAATSTNCVSSGNFTYDVDIDFDSDGVIDLSEEGSSSQGYSYSHATMAGIHTVSVIINDECGTAGLCTKVIEVVCPNNGVVTPELVGCQSETFEVGNCAGDFINFDFSIANNSCTTPGDFLVVAKVDWFSDGIIDIREDIQNIGSYSYGFSTEEGDHLIDITITDPCGEVVNCIKSFSVTCNDLGSRISGRIETEDQVAVDEVAVMLEGAPVDVEMTSDDGNYSFPVMSHGGDYRISPSKLAFPLNGVSTLDLILIQKHILGIQRLDSPYKLIAADVDNSGSVNGIDLVELRKLILGINDEFPNNTSWRMIDGTQQFQDYNNPFLNSISENYVISDLDTDMVIDFVGVKVGDVNNSVELKGRGLLEGRSNTTYKLSCNSKRMIEGETSEIIFGLDGEELLNGAQLELAFDVSKVEILEVIPLIHDMATGNFNTNKLDRGKLSLSWNTAKKIAGEEFFKLVVKVKKTVLVNDVISLTEDGYAQEAYLGTEAVDLQLDFGIELGDKVVLYQNAPNPWSQYTEIKYSLPQDNDIVLSVYDINGRVLYQEQKFANKGLNKILVSKDEINTGGILYYELIADNVRYVQKMVVIH